MIPMLVLIHAKKSFRLQNDLLGLRHYPDVL
jgi:hypothetical protein